MKIENIERGRRLSDHFDRIQKRKQDHEKVDSRVDRAMAIRETLYLLDDDRVVKVEGLVLDLLEEEEMEVVKQIEEL